MYKKYNPNTHEITDLKAPNIRLGFSPEKYYFDTDGNKNNTYNVISEAKLNTLNVFKFEAAIKTEFQKFGNLIKVGNKITNEVIDMTETEISDYLKQRDQKGFSIMIVVDYSLIERDLITGTPAPLTYFSETLKNRNAVNEYNAETRQYTVYLNYWRDNEKAALLQFIAAYNWDTLGLITITEI